MRQDLSDRTTHQGTAAITPEGRALQRRLAFAASTRNARIVGKITGACILLLGIIFGALLSGFGVWTPHVSFITISGTLIGAAAISWFGAVLLQTPALAALLFSFPMVVGAVFAAFARQWWACAALLASMVIPFAALTLYRFDQRKTNPVDGL
jgi:uncharacterized membrane protein YoaK (UPF0700 family)